MSRATSNSSGTSPTGHSGGSGATVENDPQLAEHAHGPVAEAGEQAMARLVRLDDTVLHSPGAPRGGGRLEGGDELRADAAALRLGMNVCIDPPELTPVVERAEGDHPLAVEEDERVALEVEGLPLRLEVAERILGPAVQRPLVRDHELGDGGASPGTGGRRPKELTFVIDRWSRWANYRAEG